MPGLGLGLSISARNAITAGSSAPSGIPVASTNAIIVSNFPDAFGSPNSGGSVTCQKVSGSFYSNPSFNNGFEGSMSIDFFNNQWVFDLTYFDQGELYSSFSSFNTGVSSIIPIVGWSSIAITITAA